jgi:hypothetical protein
MSATTGPTTIAGRGIDVLKFLGRTAANAVATLALIIIVFEGPTIAAIAREKLK